MKVGTDATFPPMEFVEDGKRTGFDVEMVEAIGNVLGRKIEWVDIDFKGLIPGLMSRRFDMAVSAIYITDERKKVVDFTDTYYAGGLVAMTREDNTGIQKLSDLNGKKVTVQVGTKSVSYLKDKFPQVQLVEVEKNQEMFNLVDIGRSRRGRHRQAGGLSIRAHAAGPEGARRAIDGRGIRHGAAARTRPS